MYSIPKNQSNSGLKISLTAGGITLALGLGYLYYQRKNTGNTRELELSKETVLRILKEFRKEFYPVFKNISIASMKIQNEYKQRYNMPADQMREVLQIHLIDENPLFKPQIHDVEDRVYSKFDVINRKEFEKLCAELAKGDITIRNMMEEIKDLFKKAVLGVLKAPHIDLPPKFNNDSVLHVYKDTVKQVLRQITEYIRKYTEENGKIASDDVSFHTGIQNLNIDQIKSSILKNAGFDISEEFHPQQVFSSAVVKFSKEHPAFNEKVNQIDRVNHELMQRLFNPDADFDQIIADLSKFDQVLAPPEPIIALVDPSELYPPVPVHNEKNEEFLVHVDDHVHIERSFHENNNEDDQPQNNESEVQNVLQSLNAEESNRDSFQEVTGDQTNPSSHNPAIIENDSIGQTVKEHTQIISDLPEQPTAIPETQDQLNDDE